MKFLILGLKKNEDWIETKIEQIMIIMKLSKININIYFFIIIFKSHIILINENPASGYF